MKTAKRKDGVKIAVLGAGSWGTTLALLLDGKGYRVSLWEYFPELAAVLRKNRENKRFLPGIRLPRSLMVTSSTDEALVGATHVLFVTPSHTVRGVAKLILDSPHFHRKLTIINAA